MKILPISNLGYQTYPLVNEQGEYIDGVIDITDEEYNGINAGTKQFNAEKTGIIDRNIEFEISIYKNQLRIAELKQLLIDTNDEAIMFAEGELTEEEYAETKAKRRAWRAELKTLENQENTL